MKILVLNWRDITHPWAGGAELNIHEQAKHWVDSGHQVTLFCGGYKGCSPYDTIDGIKIIRKGGRFSIYFWAFYFYVKKFRNQFDVIVDIENGIPFFTPLFSKVPKVCLLHHVHTRQFRKEFRFPLAQVGIFLEAVIMPLVYKNVPFITVSESSLTELVKLGINPDHCQVVYNGLDHQQYRPDQNIKSIKPLIVYLGRLMAYKQVDKLIRFMHPILEKQPEAELHIIGGGTTEENLKQLTHQLNLDDKVFFHGYVSEQEKVTWLQKAWLLATASLNEGWGLVVIEANACGVPAVAFNVPGLSESVNDNYSGRLVETDEDFIDQILEILSNADYRKRLSDGAIKHAAKYSWQNAAEQSLDILIRTIEEHNWWESEKYQKNEHALLKKGEPR